METGSASGKRKKSEEDTISKLTDDLLLKILSCLKTKDAVRTCILSKRWKSVWQYLPNLDFDYYDFPLQQKREMEERGYSCSFSNFISQVLFRRHPTDLVKVCVRAEADDSAVDVLDGLICYAIIHKVQQLNLFLHETDDSYDSDDSYELPESFWTCPSLIALNAYRKLPKLLACPALKYLRLSCPHFSGPNFVTTIFSGCPNLETLELIGAFVPYEDEPNLCINALNLKRLVVSFDVIGVEFKLEIYAPQLTTFEFSTYEDRLFAPIVSLRHNAASLDYVYFDIRSANEEEHVLHLINLINEFRHTKSLTLSLSTVELLMEFPSLMDQNRVTFDNLKHLKIQDEGWPKKSFEIPACILNHFLNSSTMLKICN